LNADVGLFGSNSPAKGRTLENGSTNLGKLYGLIISRWHLCIDNVEHTVNAAFLAGISFTADLLRWKQILDSID